MAGVEAWTLRRTSWWRVGSGRPMTTPSGGEPQGLGLPRPGEAARPEDALEAAGSHKPFREANGQERSTQLQDPNFPETSAPQVVAVRKLLLYVYAYM